MTSALLLDLDETLIEEDSAAVAGRQIGISSTEGSGAVSKATMLRPRRYGDGQRPTGAQPGQERSRRRVSTTGHGARRIASGGLADGVDNSASDASPTGADCQKDSRLLGVRHDDVLGLWSAIEEVPSGQPAALLPRRSTSNLQRLAETKSTYDPDNFFRRNNNVLPAS